MRLTFCSLCSEVFSYCPHNETKLQAIQPVAELFTLFRLAIQTIRPIRWKEPTQKSDSFKNGHRFASSDSVSIRFKPILYA